jgi:hypothetical protein
VISKVAIPERYLRILLAVNQSFWACGANTDIASMSIVAPIPCP